MDNYGNDSIKSLGILGGVRAKPASVGIESHNHTFIEILANAIDEASAGYGHEIIVTKNADGSITVRDFGRGVPMDKNKNGEYAYKKIFDEFFAGGKYDNNESDDGNYKYSLGTNGLGAVACNYTSDFFKATAWYGDGKSYTVTYEKGVETSNGLIINKDDSPRGTEILWKPSAEVFRGKGEVDDEFIENTLADQAVVNGGLKFVFTNKKTDTTKEFYYENGVVDYIKSLSNEEQMLTDVISLTTEQSGRDNEDDKEYRIKANIYFSFNRETSFARYYHNSSWLENGGTPEDFIKNSFVFVIDKFLKDKNMYKKGEKKISFDDINDSLVIVTSTYSTISLFTDQTKKKIGSDFMKKAITDWLREQITVYFVENPLEADLVLKQVLVNKHSRERAERTRLDVKRKLEKSNNNFEKIDKLIECRSKDPKEREIYIAEGDSAKDSLLQGRDKIFQSIYPIRGKILSCLKATPQQIFNNEVVTNIYKILGCGVELKDKNNKSLSNFSLDNLQYNKIIIAADQDDDGHAIASLLLTMFYVLSPTLLKGGYIYRAESPLFEIYDIKNDKLYYAYSDKERDNIIKENKLTNYDVSRNKGLGELQPETVEETLMKPETRKLVKYTIEDIDEVVKYLELFMGQNVEPRRDFIEKHFDEYEFEI